MGFGYGGGVDQGARISSMLRGASGVKPKKTIYKDSMVAHLWANQSQEWARNPKGILYFIGATIYSYGSHFPIARFTQNKKGARVCLFTTRGYSHTTGGHISDVSHALSDSETVFRVEDVGAESESRHAANLSLKIKAFNAALADTKNTRLSPATRASRFAALGRILDDARAYRNAFLPAAKYPLPKLPKTLIVDAANAEFDSALREFKAATAAKGGKIGRKSYWRARPGTLRGVIQYTREQISTLRKARKAIKAGATRTMPEFDASRALKVWRVARKRAANVAFKSYFYHGYDSFVGREQRAIRQIDEARQWPANTINSARTYTIKPDSYMSQYAARDMAKMPEHCAQHGLEIPAGYESAFAALKVAIEEQKRLATLSAAEKIEAWRNGKAVDLPYALPTMLRVCGDTMETSRGAEFPAEHARKAWPLISAVYKRGVAWKRNGQQIRLGHFAIDSIDTSGTIRAGCHTIERNEIEQAARLLGMA